MDLLKGRIQGNKDGYGFFIPEDGSGDMFLGTREMEKLFDGDEVLARHSGFDNRGRREGMVVEILKRRFEQIVGRYYREDGFGILVPDSKRVSHEILIPDQACRKCRGWSVRRCRDYRISEQATQGDREDCRSLR